MLKTLDRYIESETPRDDFSESLWTRFARDRRFDVLLAVSIIAHLAFYAAMVYLNYWAMRQIKPVRPNESVALEVTRILPSAGGYELRARPEPLERADISRLEYDPENPNDTNLVNRSPNPTSERGSGGLIPASPQVESGSRASTDQGASMQNAASAQSATTPASAPPGNLPRIDAPPASHANAPLPMPSIPQPSPGPSSNLPNPPTPAGSRQATGSEDTAFGFERTRAHYEALVREKISRVNQRNMPREYIKDLLSSATSVTFELTLRRGGAIQSLRLTSPSRFRVLDDAARQVIYNASPFEGYPLNASETITFTVIVHYYPIW